MRRNRVLSAVIAVATMAAAATACEPPVRPVFHAVDTAAGPDVAPGDGVCATADGGCSLEAAIDEANTLPRARILVTGEHPGFSGEVTGNLELWGEAFAGAGQTELRVAEGATLWMRDFYLGALAVDGSVIAERVGFDFNDLDRSEPPNLVVGPTGAMVAVRVTVMGWIQDAVHNEGQLSLRYTTFWSASSDYGATAPVITTAGAGTTTLGASVFLGDEAQSVAACGGTPPVSEGWNVSYDTTCGLTGPGDVEGVTVLEQDPVPGSVISDAVPLGTLECQAGPSDRFGTVQAYDDEGGPLACDVGDGQI